MFACAFNTNCARFNRICDVEPIKKHSNWTTHLSAMKWNYIYKFASQRWAFPCYKNIYSLHLNFHDNTRFCILGMNFRFYFVLTKSKWARACYELMSNPKTIFVQLLCFHRNNKTVDFIDDIKCLIKLSWECVRTAAAVQYHILLSSIWIIYAAALNLKYVVLCNTEKWPFKTINVN